MLVCACWLIFTYHPLVIRSLCGSINENCLNKFEMALGITKIIEDLSDRDVQYNFIQHFKSNEVCWIHAISLRLILLISALGRSASLTNTDWTTKMWLWTLPTALTIFDGLCIAQLRAALRSCRGMNLLIVWIFVQPWPWLLLSALKPHWERFALVWCSSKV